MADYNFFPVNGPFSLNAILENSKTTTESKSSNLKFAGVSPLSTAGKNDISFLDNSKYVKDLLTTQAGAVILKQEFIKDLPVYCVGLISKNPHLSFALVSQMFHPLPDVLSGINKSSNIDATAEIGEGCQIEAGVWIGPYAKIGKRCLIAANVVIGEGVTVGDDSRIGSNASLEYCKVGTFANIHSGVRIGSRGFGFAIDPAGFVDVPQTGRVIIGHKVEIGGNSTIDRGMGPDTIIGDGCKIDNLIHIAHNVKLGRGCVMAAMSGIAGSTELGDFVVCGAQSGISGHLKIGSGVQIAAKAGVTKNLAAGSIVGGFPAEPINTWRKRHATTTRLMKKKG